ncbi:hypothetical protein CJ030_MR8G004402 [Morella rubra]|uniref:Uncharacterized protein n=1 Tax=Morella rubra TaxID=262757 RepID=A0A6A1UQ07_9ROSI|nr:hypothetical protein CJ030_MR8G004402 [Morella rubra]
MDSPPISSTTSPTLVIFLSSPPPPPLITPLNDLPLTPPNRPQSPDTEAHEFALSCLEPFGFDRSLPRVITRDLIDSLESRAIPPSGFLGPTLADYLDAHSYSRPSRHYITLGPCTKRPLPTSSHAAPVVSPHAPSTALVPFHPAPVDFSKCFKGKGKMDSDIPSIVPVQVMPAPNIFQSVPNLTRGYIDKGKRLVSLDSSDLVVKPSVQPSVENNTLAMEIRSRGLASAPRAILPHAPFFKDAAMEDSFWKSKAADPILAVLKKSKTALTSFKRDQTRLKKKAAARTTQAQKLTDEPFSCALDHTKQQDSSVQNMAMEASLKDAIHEQLIREQSLWRQWRNQEYSQRESNS